MLLKTACLILSVAHLVKSEAVGYFDSDHCVDNAGMKDCYADADSYLSTCITKNCAGGSDACAASCGGNAACIQSNCPNLGIDCINACECVRATKEIECAAQSCWNQVYSCEYQETVRDFINVCTNPDLKNIPFWPPPDDAPASCSCNIGKIDMTQLEAVEIASTCANNETALGQFTSVEEINAFAQGCMCCGNSLLLSAYWDICPDTKPTLLGADDWTRFLADHKWNKCEQYLEKYDCATTMGFGNKTSGGKSGFFAPGDLPENGTATLSNVDGAISSPVSGATFTWKNGDVPRTIVAAEVTDGAGTQASPTSGDSESPSMSAAGSDSPSSDGISTYASPRGSLCLFLLAVTAWTL
ncbi:hypothetical protein Q7P37_010891 [Cladosporium fusiforme]